MNTDPATRDPVEQALFALDQQRIDDALVLLRAAVATGSGGGRAHHLLAALQAEAGDHEAAIRHFATAVEIEPDLLHARFQFMQLLFVTGRDAMALQAGEPLTALPQTHALYWYAHALLALCRGEADAAAAALASGLERTQDIPALAADMQRLMGRLHEPATAEHARPALFLTGYATQPYGD